MSNWRFYLDGNEVEEPIGWDAIEFTAIRTETHGIDQPFSTEVKFYAEGARYIKSIYDQYFINQPIAITITSDVGYNNAPYQFDGFLNLAIYEEHNVCDTDTWEITVGIIDDQFREKFKSRMDVDIDVYSNKDLDGDTIPDITFDETRLHTQEVYLAGFAQSYAQPYPIAYWADLYWTYGGGWIAEDFAAVIPAYFGNSDFKGAFGSTLDPNGVKWNGYNMCFRNNGTQARTITFNVSIRGAFIWSPSDGKPGESASLAVGVGLFYNNDPNKGGMVTETFIGDSAPNYFNSGVYTQYDFSGTVTYYVPVGQMVSIYMQWGGNGNIVPGDELDGDIGRRIYAYVDDCCLSVTEKNSAEYASFSDTLYVENFLKRLVHIITGNSNGFVSDTFSKINDGCYWNYALTNGLKIRRAKTVASANAICDPYAVLDETNFQTSFKKVYEGLNAIFCLGWAFEYIGGQWKVRVESVEYFYQNQVAFTALNVGEVTQSAMTDKLANQFVIGYDDKWKNIQAAGLWAIHTDRNYYINNRAMQEGTTKKVEILSNIIAEGYAIEFSRRMYFFQDNSGSSDRPNDYNMFIIWLNRLPLTINNIQDSEYGLPLSYNETGTVVLPPGTVSMSSRRITQSNSEVGDLYNIYITPARNAYRWWKILGMHTYGLTDPRLRFTSGQYQISYSSIVEYQQEKLECIELQTGLSYGGVREDDDVTPDKMAEAYKKYLFKPIQAVFDYPQSLCDFLTLSQDEQYRKVRLTSGGLGIEGYIIDAKNKPEDASGGTTKFTLLVSNFQSEPGGAFDEGYDTGYVVE